MSALRKTKWMLGLIVLWIIVWALRTAGYLIFEFVIPKHVNTFTNCNDHLKEIRHIPDYMHQIYFPITRPLLSKTHESKRKSWTYFHQSFKHLLWNETAVIKLMRKDHPNLEQHYHSYGHWVQRIDVAKYVILYHYGGWYIDLDITCRTSVNQLAYEMLKSNKSAVFHAEDTLGPATDFIGITPRHPYIKSIIDALPFSNRWFVLQHTTIMFSTGPSFIWGRYRNYPCQDELLILNKSTFGKYAYLSHDNSWWGADSRFIYYSLDHKLPIFVCIMCICSIGIVLRVCHKRKSITLHT